MDIEVIKARIADMQKKTSVCSNGSQCINLLIHARRLLFDLPASDHVTFIDVSEEVYQIHCDDDSCRIAAGKCKHASVFDASKDVDFRR